MIAELLKRHAVALEHERVPVAVLLNGLLQNVPDRHVWVVERRRNVVRILREPGPGIVNGGVCGDALFCLHCPPPFQVRRNRSTQKRREISGKPLRNSIHSSLSEVPRRSAPWSCGSSLGGERRG